MIIRVNWATPNSNVESMYHVYSANEYFVEYFRPAPPEGSDQLQKCQVRLMIDGEKHDVLLSCGDTAYIMNDSGKTVEVIRTQ